MKVLEISQQQQADGSLALVLTVVVDPMEPSGRARFDEVYQLFDRLRQPHGPAPTEEIVNAQRPGSSGRAPRGEVVDDEPEDEYPATQLQRTTQNGGAHAG